MRFNHIIETESTTLNGIRIILRAVKPYIQSGVLILAFWIALTRVKDYYHHPLDVAAGAFMGAFLASITFYQSKLYSCQQIQERDKSDKKVIPKRFLTKNIHFRIRSEVEARN